MIVLQGDGSKAAYHIGSSIQHPKGKHVTQSCAFTKASEESADALQQQTLDSERKDMYP